MAPRTAPLPPRLSRRPSSTLEGASLGLSTSRLRAADLCSPFASVRMTADAAPESLAALAEAYAQKIAPGAFFSHATSAALHGMWLPLAAEQSRTLDVSVVRPARAPRDSGVRGHHLIERPGLRRAVGTLAAAGRVETWCQLGTQLRVPDLVVAGEALMTPAHPDALLVLDRLIAAAQDPGRPAHGRLVRAAALLRPRSRSPRETALRLILEAAGLPEPEINADIEDAGGRFVAECDLVYRERRILLEHEGDQHRTDPAQFRKDLARYELLQDLGWRVIRVTSGDLINPAPLLARLRRMLGVTT